MIASAAPADTTRFGLVVALWLAGLGAAAQYGKVSVVYDMLPTLYPGAGAALGWAVSLVGVVGIVFGVLAGAVVGQVGLRRAMLLGLGGGALCSLLQALALPFWLFLLLRVVEGLSHLALVVAAPTLISEVSAPRHRGLTLTLWGTFFGVAFAVIAALGIPLAGAYGVPALFFAHGVWMASFAALLWLVLPRDKARTEGPLRLGQSLVGAMRLYRSPRIGAPALGWLFYTFAFVSLLTLIPPYLPEAARVPTLTAMPIVSIVSSLVVGVAMLRVMSAVRVIQIGFVAAAAGVAALTGSETISPMLCLAIAAALGLVQGATFSAVPELLEAPADRALANGGLAQMGNLGNTLGVPVLAAGIAVGGLAGLTVPLALALAAGAAVHLWMAVLRQER